MLKLLGTSLMSTVRGSKSFTSHTGKRTLRERFARSSLMHAGNSASSGDECCRPRADDNGVCPAASRHRGARLRLPYASHSGEPLLHCRILANVVDCDVAGDARDSVPTHPSHPTMPSDGEYTDALGTSGATPNRRRCASSLATLRRVSVSHFPSSSVGLLSGMRSRPLLSSECLPRSGSLLRAVGTRQRGGAILPLTHPRFQSGDCQPIDGMTEVRSASGAWPHCPCSGSAVSEIPSGK